MTLFLGRVKRVFLRFVRQHLPNLSFIQGRLLKSPAVGNGTRITVAIAVGLEEV
jgi:hypothetical protein